MSENVKNNTGLDGAKNEVQGKKMQITKTQASAVFWEGVRLLELGDIDGAEQQRDHLSKKGAWFHAEKLDARIENVQKRKMQITKTEAKAVFWDGASMVELGDIDGAELQRDYLYENGAWYHAKMLNIQIQKAAA